MKLSVRRIFATLMALVAVMSVSAAEVKTLVEADFTKFTNGSLTSPVALYSSNFTTTVGATWTPTKVYAAGGQILIQDGGKLQSPYLPTATEADGAIKITLRARAVDTTGCAVTISIGYSIKETLILPDGEWHDVSLVLATKIGSYTRMSVEPLYAASGILLESAKVEQSTDFLAAPVAKQPTVATATSFTATWNAVAGVTGYQLDVYSYGADDTRDYLIKSQAVTGTSYKVTGMDAAKQYFFVVRAVKDEAVSEDSNEIEVVAVITSLATPVLDKPTVTDSGFTATWGAVENAQSYLVSLYRHYTLTEAGEADILADDFSNVNIGSLSSPEYPTSAQMVGCFKTPGWSYYAPSLSLAKGYIGLGPISSSEAYIESPELDLSANNGQFSVTVKLAEMRYGTYYNAGELKVVLYDAEGNALETNTIEISEKSFAEYTTNFTKGTKDCTVYFAYSGDYIAYIDELAISQSLPAGSTVSTLKQEYQTETNSITIELAKEANSTYGYTVTAVGRTVSAGTITPIQSAASEEMMVGETSAIDGITDDAAATFSVVKSAAGTLTVTVAEAGVVTVYDVNGRVLAAASVVPGSTQLKVNGRGLVIVSFGGKAVKAIL